MTDEPRVGEPSEEYRSVCVFAFRPGEPQCGAPATTHVAVKSETAGMVALATCTDHLSIARASGTVIAEHPHAGFCGFPGSLWAADWSHCLLDGSGPDRQLAWASSAPFVFRAEDSREWRADPPSGCFESTGSPR